MSDIDVSAIEAEIAQLRAQVKVLMDRIGDLQKLTERPVVVPVLDYWRYSVRHQEPAELWGEDDALLEAFRELEAMSDAGACAPVGVLVNGVEIPYTELVDRYGYAT